MQEYHKSVENFPPPIVRATSAVANGGYAVSLWNAYARGAALCRIKSRRRPPTEARRNLPSPEGRNSIPRRGSAPIADNYIVRPPEKGRPRAYIDSTIPTLRTAPTSRRSKTGYLDARYATNHFTTYGVRRGAYLAIIWLRPIPPAAQGAPKLARAPGPCLHAALWVSREWARVFRRILWYACHWGSPKRAPKSPPTDRAVSSGGGRRRFSYFYSRAAQ